MKKNFLNLRLIIPLALLLFAIILAQSVLEYRSSRKAVLDLLHNQAGALLMSAARAGEKGIIAYEIQQDKIREHLFTIATMVDKLAKVSKTSSAELDEIARENGLAVLTVIGPGGKSLYSFGPIIDLNLIKPVLSGELSRMPLGFVDMPGSSNSFAVTVSGNRGGAIITGIDATELLELRKTFGAGSVIDDICQSPGVVYGGLVGDGFLLAASKDFPKNSSDDWYRTKAADDSIATRITMASPETGPAVFEARGPFTVSGEYYGEIVIGIDTGYLSLLTSKLRRDIFWRSLLFLFVAVAGIGGFLTSQNYRHLSRKYLEIQDDVQKLERDREMSARLVAMGELASGVAHEIRNPLNAIKVIVQRLQREFEPKNDGAEYSELIGVVKKETDRINKTVEEYLRLARPPVLHKTMSNMNECIKEVATLFEPRARAKGCAMNLELGPLPPQSFDQELCRQAMLNLLENSLAEVPGEGKIDIRTCRKDDNCVIEVSDNGPGIPDIEKGRVFDLYYTTKPSGTGIGLPTVLRIVKEHGGRIDLLDGPAGGALFRVELPLEQ